MPWHLFESVLCSRQLKSYRITAQQRNPEKLFYTVPWNAKVVKPETLVLGFEYRRKNKLYFPIPSCPQPQIRPRTGTSTIFLDPQEVTGATRDHAVQLRRETVRPKLQAVVIQRFPNLSGSHVLFAERGSSNAMVRNPVARLVHGWATIVHMMKCGGSLALREAMSKPWRRD